jgi:hypothetical protein
MIHLHAPKPPKVAPSDSLMEQQRKGGHVATKKRKTSTLASAPTGSRVAFEGKYIPPIVSQRESSGESSVSDRADYGGSEKGIERNIGAKTTISVTGGELVNLFFITRTMLFILGYITVWNRFLTMAAHQQLSDIPSWETAIQVRSLFNNLLLMIGCELNSNKLINPW